VGGFSTYMAHSSLYLYTIPGGEANLKRSDLQMPQFQESTRNLLWFQLFVFLWTVALISALFKMSVAGGVASWYFNREKSHGSATLRSLGRGLTKSFGSLALGSLILAVVELVNCILNQLQKANAKNKVMLAILCCVRCLFSCVQRFVQFIDNFVYIHIAMYGDSFCTSAKSVTSLIERHMFTAVMVDFLGSFVLFVGKILGCGLCILFSVLLMNYTGRNISGVIISFVGVFSFVIFSIFAYMISFGVSTVMVCYLEDMDRNKDGQLHISSELHTLLKHKHAEVNVNKERPRDI